MTHVKGYIKKDGTIVKPHDDKRKHGLKKLAHDWTKKYAPSLLGLFDDDEDGEAPVEKKPKGTPHPERGDKGETIYISHPSTATDSATWTDPKQIATFVPGGEVPKELNGVAFSPWTDAPSTPEDWDEVEGQFALLEEPEFDPGKKEPAAGVVVEEPDGRLWVIHPTNGFGGYKATFPKGRTEHDINPQASAIKEAFEESGLKVEITGFLMDVNRSVTKCRYYTARRVGGTPAAMGWESQATSLVPRSKLYEVLNNWNDHPMAEALGAGPQPPKPEPIKPKFDSKSHDWPKSGGSGNWSGGSGSLLPPPKLVKKPS